MTRGPKGGGRSDGSGTGARRTRASTVKVSKPKVPGFPAAETSVAAAPAEKPVTKTPPATRKTLAAKPGAGKAGPRREHSHESGSPAGDGHGKAQAARLAGSARRKANKRGAARFHAVQALWQMEITGAGLNEVLAQFESQWLGREVEGEQYLPAEAAFFRDIVSGVVCVQRDLDPRIDAALEASWPLKRIEAILRSVLRAGAYELEKRTDVPARVVVSEYVDVADAFVDKTETGMVNAVLDRLARDVRAAEFG